MCSPSVLFLILGPKLLWENIVPVNTVWCICWSTISRGKWKLDISLQCKEPVVRRTKSNFCCRPVMKLFRAGRGLKGWHSSMSLPDPSSSGTSMSESSSFTAGEEMEWKWRFKPQADEAVLVNAAVFLTGAPHQVPLLLPQFVLHHPHHVFSLLPLKQSC